MESASRFEKVFPIGDTDPQNLPVADVASAAPFYEQSLGFTLVERSDEGRKTVRLRRNAVEIVLAENGGDPEQASCYFAVSDVDQAFADLHNKNVDTTPIQVQEHNGTRYRVFFVRAPDGLCFCLGQPA